MHIHGTILTYESPSSNHRGESEGNVMTLQQLVVGDEAHAIMSSQSIRSAMREGLSHFGYSWENGNVNRRRVLDSTVATPQVEYRSFPDPESLLVDDAVFGYAIARGNLTVPANRRSLVRVNHAVSLRPLSGEVLLQQAPRTKWNDEELQKAAGAKKKKAKDVKKAKAEGEGEGEEAVESDAPRDNEAAILNYECLVTSFQYPFSLVQVNKWNKQWLEVFIKLFGSLGAVAGQQSRSLFDFTPRSIVIRKTNEPAPQYNQYGFDLEGNFEALSRISKDDLDGSEFWVGGEIVRNMSKEVCDALRLSGVNLYKNPQRMLQCLAEELCKEIS